jgi:hypothetical protein
MAIGTAIVVLGIIGFCIASPGFRRFVICSVVAVTVLLGCIIVQDLERRSSPKVHAMSDAEMGIKPNPFDEFDEPKLVVNPALQRQLQAR